MKQLVLLLSPNGYVDIKDKTYEDDIGWALDQGYRVIGSAECELADHELERAVKKMCHERIGELHDALNAILGIARNV